MFDGSSLLLDRVKNSPYVTWDGTMTPATIDMFLSWYEEFYWDQNGAMMARWEEWVGCCRWSIPMKYFTMIHIYSEDRQTSMYLIIRTRLTRHRTKIGQARPLHLAHLQGACHVYGFRPSSGAKYLGIIHIWGPRVIQHNNTILQGANGNFGPVGQHIRAYLVVWW